MRNKFWKWTKNKTTGKRILRLDGVIDDWKISDGDSLTTPKEFRDELNSCDGDIEIYIRSPGGNIFSAAEIYSMLKEYKGNITAKIPSFAASAATVVMCACDVVEVGELAMLCIHNPFLECFCGNEQDLEEGIEFLRELKENIVNIYRQKTGLSRNKISELMDAETYMNAYKAIELNFADKLMGDTGDTQEELSPQMYSIKPNINLLFRAYQLANKEKEKSIVGNPYKRLMLGCDNDLFYKAAEGANYYSVKGACHDYGY